LKKCVFIDTDILFSFFALNKEKREIFENNGSTGDQDLDKILKIIFEIEENKETICISELSLLELIALLNRRKKSKLIPQIIIKIYQWCDIFPINDLIMKLSWYISANYKFHSGDVLHLAFCLANEIDYMIIKDKDFINSFNQIKEEFETIGLKNLANFFKSIPFAKEIPKEILKMYENLNKLQIKEV
jgi:predicted nucleic acid-binding protein